MILLKKLLKSPVGDMNYIQPLRVVVVVIIEEVIAIIAII
jgi:hypothetical protein